MQVEVANVVSLAVSIEGLEELKCDRLLAALIRNVQMELESVNVDLDVILLQVSLFL